MSVGEIAPADLAACREVIRVHSRSFYAASLLLPGDVRDAAMAAYAFCRGADDDVDGVGGPDAARERHARTRQRLERLYAGEPMDTPVSRAFAWVVQRHRIPQEEPGALLAGMAQDLGPVQMRSADELLLYCYRAAGVVGLMMSRIMGRANEAARRRAVDLGIAMQLSNIARDVGEDARRHRVYLPATWLAEAGTTPAAVLGAVPSPGVLATTRRVVAVAEDYYRSGIEGIALLPRACQPAILSAALLYRAIGRKVRARNGDGVTQRARIGGPRKVGYIALACARVACDPRLRGGRVAGHRAELHASLLRAGVSV